jgi:hypothetical protein
LSRFGTAGKRCRDISSKKKAASPGETHGETHGKTHGETHGERTSLPTVTARRDAELRAVLQADLPLPKIILTTRERGRRARGAAKVACAELPREADAAALAVEAGEEVSGLRLCRTLTRRPLAADRVPAGQISVDRVPVE